MQRYELAAVESGTFEIELEYQSQPLKRDGESGFGLPTQHALVNELMLDPMSALVEGSLFQA